MRTRRVQLAALFLALVLPGCCSGLNPILMEKSVKPLAGFADRANGVVADAQAAVNAAKAHAETLPAAEKASLNAAADRVAQLFSLPRKPGEPHLLEDISLGGKELMATIARAREGGESE